MKQGRSLLDQIGHPRVLVIGDVMLDRYTWGHANRTSQEAPVPILKADRREDRPGGAASVSHMLSVLEAEVTVAGVVGADSTGERIRTLLEDYGVRTDLLLTDSGRCSTLKERFVGQSGSGLPSQMLRVDTECTDPLRSEIETQLTQAIVAEMPSFDVVLISDYAKGVCTAGCIGTTIRAAQSLGIPVLVDPGRERDFSIYSGATLIKPNRVETELATGRMIRTSDDALEAGRELCRRYDLQMAVITLDSDGIALVSRSGKLQMFATRARSVYDITGAGDMVLAVLGMGFGAQLPVDQSAELANVAAGLEVDRTGVATLRREEIISAMTSSSDMRHRSISAEQAAVIAAEHRLRGKTIVFTNGCFDLLHAGHLRYLEEAAAMGDLLFVGLNTDQSIRRLKGPARPIISELDRAALLSGLSCVDYVVLFDEDTPHRLLHAIRPHILVKGGTYREHEVVGREVVEAYGGRVCVTSVTEGVSTSRLVETIQKTPKLRVAG